MKIFNTRDELINSFQKKCVCAEIGVFKGDFSKKIKKFLEPKELHLIDLFEGVTLSGNKDGENIIYADLNSEFTNLNNYFFYDHEVKLHRGKSFDVMNNFPDNYFDFVYIDGDHSYEGVKNDLEISYHKVKKNGIICGHDYAFNFLGVMNAVNEFVEKHNLKIDFITSDKLPSFGIVNNK